MSARRSSNEESPAAILQSLVRDAAEVAKKARKHRQSLTGDNFYGNKLASLRTDATNAFEDLKAQSAGDTTALAELIQLMFSPQTDRVKRLACVRELTYALGTTWREAARKAPAGPANGLCPVAILVQTKRSYLVAVGRQMNGCFSEGWYDACAVMMRRLLEIAIIEAFENRGLAGKIKDASGNYVHLTDLVDATMREPTFKLSRNFKTMLPRLRDVGHLSAHGRYYHATKDDIERVQPGCRVVVEELLRHAGLL